MHLEDVEGPKEDSFLEYTPSEQVIVDPKVGIPLSKNRKAVACHDCRGIMASQDIRVCLKKCVVSFVIHV